MRPKLIIHNKKIKKKKLVLNVYLIVLRLVKMIIESF